MIGPEKLELIKQGKSITHGLPSKRNISAKVMVTAAGTRSKEKLEFDKHGNIVLDNVSDYRVSSAHPNYKQQNNLLP